MRPERPVCFTGPGDIPGAATAVAGRRSLAGWTVHRIEEAAVTSRLDSYLHFPDSAPVRLVFYREVFGGDDPELRGYFEAPAAGRSVTMPLEKQVWGDEFGMCTDRFGVEWLVNVFQPTG
jgi:uncharacterized glyoxalase superfamily protein PhnB